MTTGGVHDDIPAFLRNGSDNDDPANFLGMMMERGDSRDSLPPLPNLGQVVKQRTCRLYVCTCVYVCKLEVTQRAAPPTAGGRVGSFVQGREPQLRTRAINASRIIYWHTKSPPRGSYIIPDVPTRRCLWKWPHR